MCQATKQLVAAIVVNDRFYDDAPEGRHSRDEPRRYKSAVKRKVSTAGSVRHCGSMEYCGAAREGWDVDRLFDPPSAGYFIVAGLAALRSLFDSPPPAAAMGFMAARVVSLACVSTCAASVRTRGDNMRRARFATALSLQCRA